MPFRWKGKANILAEGDERRTLAAGEASSPTPEPSILTRSSSFEDLQSKADICTQNGQHAQAAKAYSDALHRVPQDVRCLLGRSLAYMSLDQPDNDAAIRDADLAIDSEPSSWHAWNQNGNALTASGRYGEAVQAFQRAARLASKSSPLERLIPQQMLLHVRRLKTTSDTAASPPQELSTPPVQTSRAPQPTIPSLNVPPELVGSGSTTPSTERPNAIALNPPTSAVPLLDARSTSPNPMPATSVPLNAVSEVPADSYDTSFLSEPPPSYSRDATPVVVQREALSTTSINAKSQQLRQALVGKQTGMVQLKSSTLPGQIDSIQLQHIGFTAIESTIWDMNSNSLLRTHHVSLDHCYVDTILLPGNQYLDSDPETSVLYEGTYPGTVSIFGANEEYRAAQLRSRPMLSLTLEGNLVPPIMPMDDIIKRLRLLQTNPTLEDNEALKNTLGLTSWQSATLLSPGRLQQIDAICMGLNKGKYDAPTRFFSFSTAVNLSAYYLGPAISLQNFLFQVLLAVELIIRVKKEPSTTSYKGLITDDISALMVSAQNWMENVSIRENTAAGLGQPRYLLTALAQDQHAQALIRFAETMSWPYVEETRHYMQTAYLTLRTEPARINNIVRDWLYGMHRPGKVFRHLLLNVLVESAASVRAIGQAGLWMDGLVVENASYWPARSVLGRVLGALPGMQTCCGIVGPVKIPITGVASPSWVYAQATEEPIPVPLAVQGPSVMQQVGLTATEGLSMEEDEAVRDLLNVDRWKTPTDLPLRPNASQSSAELRGIHLTDGRRVNVQSNPAASKLQYRIRLDFSISPSPNAARKQTSYILYSNPKFVSAAMCTGNDHPIFELKVKKLMRTVLTVQDLMNSNPPRDELTVIDARGSGEETVARAWCAERARNAVIRRPGRCCFACAVKLASKAEGLGYEVVIWAR